jgi:hypothetical protein
VSFHVVSQLLLHQCIAFFNLLSFILVVYPVFDLFHSVADMNQSLIDDGLVDKEKIGGMNYYWSFPAKKDRLQQIQYEKTIMEIANLEKDLIDANTALIEAQRGREDDGDDGEEAKAANDSDGKSNDVVENDENNMETDMTNDDSNNEPATKKTKTLNRKQKLQRLQEIEQFKTKALIELEKLKENDPQAIADLEQELRFVHQAANRWTDNIFNCQTYLVKKRGMNKKDTYKLLGITDSFDCTFNSYWFVYAVISTIMYPISCNAFFTFWLLRLLDPDDKATK